MYSATAARIDINGIAITALSIIRINLAPTNQTKEVTAKRLHDGIDDTFVLSRVRLTQARDWRHGELTSSVADTMVQSIRLCARGLVGYSI